MCREIELLSSGIDLKYIESIVTEPSVDVDLLMPGSGGAYFPLEEENAETAIITVTLKKPIEIMSIGFDNQNTNIKRFAVVLFDKDDNVLLQRRNTIGQLIVEVEIHREIWSAKLIILSTSNNLNPKNVEVTIGACSEDKDDFTTTTPRTTTKVQTTTGTLL